MTLIVIEGLDGSGKSTQANLLLSYLSEQQVLVQLRSHPSDDNLCGQLAKRFLLRKGKLAQIASAIFYILDIFHSIFFYGWRAFEYTIYVRYLMGTAYLPSPLHRIGYYFFRKIVPTPSQVFFIAISPETASARIQASRIKTEIFESLTRLIKTRKKALDLVNIGEWCWIDGEQPIYEVFQEIKNKVAV